MKPPGAVDRGAFLCADGEDLYRVLREEVIPRFYQRDCGGLPRSWRFNVNRMVMDYTLKCYVPAAGGTLSDMSQTI
jgi:hypothetical protein